MFILKKISQYKFLFFVILVYITVVGTVSVLRHYQFQTQAWDMGIFEQTMWNTVNGRVMQNSLEEIPNHLGVHMSPFLFLLVPFYIFFQTPYFLIVIQTLALGLAAIPLYFFSRNILNSEKFAKVIILSYLLNPALHSLNLFDFHDISFFIPFIFAAFYFFERKKFFWVWIFMLLAASVKEDAALISIAIVFYWFISTIIKIENKKIKISKLNNQSKKILKLFIFLIIYFLISVKLIMPALGGGLVRLDRYNHFGASTGEIVKNILFNPKLLFSTIFTSAKLKYLLFLLLPVALLPLFSFSSIFLVLPGVLENILTNYDTQFSGLYQYDAIILPGLYISAVYGLLFLRRVVECHFCQFVTKLITKSLTAVNDFVRHIWGQILSKINKPRRQIDGGKLFFYFLLGFSSLSFLYFSLLSPRQFPKDLFTNKQQTRAFSEIVKMIPKQASVAAPTNLVPHLAHRQYIRVLGNEEFFTDIVIIDRFDKFGFVSDEQFQLYFDARVNSGLYDVSLVGDRIVILKKKDL